MIIEMYFCTQERIAEKHAFTALILKILSLIKIYSLVVRRSHAIFLQNTQPS